MDQEKKRAAPKYRGDVKKYTLQYFDYLTGGETEQKVVDLRKKQREINERAKKRF